MGRLVSSPVKSYERRPELGPISEKGLNLHARLKASREEARVNDSLLWSFEQHGGADSRRLDSVDAPVSRYLSIKVPPLKTKFMSVVSS